MKITIFHGKTHYFYGHPWDIDPLRRRQDQLENVARQLGRLAQDLEATKVELAEVPLRDVGAFHWKK